MKPFIHMNDIRPSENEFARNGTLADVLDTCLNTDILPNRAKHPFRFSLNPAQVSMYVSRRTLKGAEAYDSKDDEFRYEQALSQMFWQGSGDDEDVDRRRLCVLGPTGCGKSTFVDFFLRWYCPERSDRAADFGRKVVIWFDANAAKDNERLNNNFFNAAQAWIRTACKEKNVHIEEIVGRRKLPKQNIEVWVQVALEELSTLARKGHSAIEYLVIFVDNMDQCPVKVQERILTLLENWLDMPTIRIWRIILTMWPSTFETLKNSTFNMMRNWKVLRLGLIHTETLIENRQRVINSRIAKLFQQTAGTAAAGDLHDGFRTFLDTSLRLWSQRLGGTITDLDDADEADEASSFKTAGGLVRELCNGDLRRELGLLHGFLTGQGAHRIWQQDRSTTGQPRRHDYELVESLILGPHEHMMHSTNHIGNLFMLGHRQQRPRDLLIGPHMLHLVRGSVTIHTYQVLCKALADLGYIENNFEHCFSEFRRLGILHEVRSEGLHGVGYEGHTTVINAYHHLLFHELAYLDCVAPVTAVDEECLGEMRTAYESSPDSFSRKAGCSLAFLRFLRRMETAFCNVATTGEAARRDFAAKLDAVGLPCLWRHLALRYRKRLIGLRSSGYLPHLTDEWWEKTIHSQILLDATVAKPKLSVSASG
jgi:hypothetical protein